MRRYVRRSDAPITVNPGLLPVSGRILINATTLQDTFTTRDIHHWLQPFKPADYVGYSWLVFELTPDAVANRIHKSQQLPDDYYFGSFAYTHDRLRDTERSARAVLATNPGLPEGWYLLGLSSLGLGRLDDAADAFLKIPASHASYVDARANLSFIAAVKDNAEARKTYWRQSMTEETLGAYAHRPVTDTGHYESLLTTSPNDWELRNNLGVSFWMQQKLSESEMEIRRALTLQPDFAEAYSNLAIVLEERGLYGQALDALERYKTSSFLLRTSPYRDYRVYYQDTRVMLGDTLEIFPKADEDVLRLRAQLEKNPHDVWLLNQLSAALMVKRRFGEAYESLSKALAIAPATSALYTNLALLYTEKKMFSHAVAACKRALELDPQSPTAAQLLSSVQGKMAD